MLVSKKQMFYSAVLYSIGLPMLMLVYWFSTVNLNNTSQSADLVAHTFQTKEQIERLSSDVKDAERAQRGYLLTQDPDYLKLYHVALSDKNATLQTLKDLLTDNPVQQNNLRNTGQLIQQRIDVLQQVLEVQSSSGIQAAQTIIQQGPGKKLMMAIQQQIQAMLGEENRLLRIRQAELVSSRHYVWLFSELFFALSLVLLFSGYFLLRKATGRVQHLFEDKNLYSEQLEQTNQDLALVATIASHDLRAPLRKMNFFLEQIRKDPDNVLTFESLDFLHRTEAASEKMQSLIEHVLAIARRQKSSMPEESVNLSILAHEVTEALEQQIRETNGKVEIGDMCTIKGNKFEMAQLLQNLIENSLKFRHPEKQPHIRISSTKTDDGGCELRVADNGIGIAREQQAEIFRMFKRGANSKRTTGAGIGLGTVKRIAERHQGTVRVESKPNEGAEFIVKIPAFQAN